MPSDREEEINECYEAADGQPYGVGQSVIRLKLQEVAKSFVLDRPRRRGGRAAS